MIALKILTFLNISPLSLPFMTDAHTHIYGVNEQASESVRESKYLRGQCNALTTQS